MLTHEMQGNEKPIIIYMSSAVPETMYVSQLRTEQMTDQQSQKFDRSVMEGFVANGYPLIAVSHRLGVHSNKPKKLDKLNSGHINYIVIDSCKGKLSKLLTAFDSYKTVCSLLKRFKNAVVVTNVLAISVSLGGAMAALRYKSRNISVVTDVPSIHYTSEVKKKVSNLCLKISSSYVFLTEAMNELINQKSKPYCVMEGLYMDGNAKENVLPEKDTGIFKILYAGILQEKYGAKAMVDAMKHIENEDVEMHLYGTGDYVESILKAAEADSRIKYFGIRENRDVILAERQSSLLLNPRSKHEEFTKYSFPSKTIEYMSTGTPVLMQELPGMPEEYKKYIYLYDGDSGEDLAKAIMRVYSIGEEKRSKLGNNAREFIVSEKNEKAQVGRIISELRL